MSHVRRASSLRNVVAKRSSINAPVNLNCLVRIYLLDGSSKVLQMFSNSVCRDVLIALKFNLDLNDISTFALFRVIGNNVRRVELNEVITEVLKDPTNSGQEVRLLFRSWITYKYGAFDHEVFQHTVRNKQPNTALWLAFMEAVFMCMTGKFFLSEDEAIMLGCLKMQAESGDFNPQHHDLRVIKNRVSSRFPEPARSKMKALMHHATSSSPASNNVEDLAVRVQSLYARIAGKSKVEAQINYLESLRTWCPFYGSTLYEVQCQYDDNPLDPNSSPPVIEMNAWIGPLAIFLLTPSDPPVIMRHPYRRIIKWVTLPDKHIFTYWVIKPNVTMADLEEFQDQQRRKLRRQNEEHHSDDNQTHSRYSEDGDDDAIDASQATGLVGEYDAQQFCDCVYLVTSQVKELDYLVKSYVESVTGHAPVLPGASDDLLPAKVHLSSSNRRHRTKEGGQDEEDKEDSEDDEHGRKQAALEMNAATQVPPIPTAETAKKPRVGRLSLFFSSLGSDGLGHSGSGMTTNAQDDDEENGPGQMGEEHFGDDTAAVSNSWFRNMYKTNKHSHQKSVGKGDERGKAEKRGWVLADEAKPEEIADHVIPMQVKYAASMSELKRMAEESQFSDDEDDDGDEEENGKKKTKKNVGESSEDDSSNESSEGEGDDGENEGRGHKKRIPGVSSSNAFRRASRILFG
jgi:hypothetical protein